MRRHGYIGRKKRLPHIKDKPAIVITAFSGGGRSRVPLEIFRKRLADRFPEHETFWAYGSAILRKKRGLPGLHETLARVEASGFRRVVVQPLYIFPGTEYREMRETCDYFPGLRIFSAETLLHRWEFIRETLTVVEEDFLAPDEGLNLLALHGTPLAADPANIVYLGFDQLVRDLYPNAATGAVEGIPDHEAVFSRFKRRAMAESHRRVKIIPMMFVAGVHVEEDLMGPEKSWRLQLEELGFTVECSTVQCGNSFCFKGLADYPRIIDFFLNRLEQGLFLADHF